MSRAFNYLLVAILLIGVTQAQAADTRPNVLVVLCDDLGYGDLACYGNEKIKTPHLDRLAREGQRWTSFYSSGSTCVPSRTGLMSGRHPGLLGKERLPASRESPVA